MSSFFYDVIAWGSWVAVGGSRLLWSQGLDVGKVQVEAVDGGRFHPYNGEDSRWSSPNQCDDLVDWPSLAALAHIYAFCFTLFS